MLTKWTHEFEYLLGLLGVEVMYLDNGLRMERFSGAFAKRFGLGTDDLQKSFKSFAKDELGLKILELAAEALDTGNSQRRETVDSSETFTLLGVSPHRVERAIHGVFVTLIDIERSVQPDPPSMDRGSRFERAVASTSDGVWEWSDISSETMWWSDQCFRLLGYAPKEIPATISSWTERIHPVDRKLMRKTTVIGNQRCFVDLHRDFEYRMRHKSGAYRWFRHHILMQTDKNGKLVGMSGAVVDIDVQKQAELRAQSEIDRRDRFLTMLTHELRNPMAAIVGALELLEAEQTERALPAIEQTTAAGAGPDTQPATQSEDDLSHEALVSIIRRQVKQMTRVLDDLLAVSNFRQDPNAFCYAQCDLVSLTQEVMLAVQHEIDARAQHLNSSMFHRSVIVLADQERFRKCQVHILETVSRFSRNGSVLYYEVGIDNESAVIKIRAPIQGVPDDELEELFDFYVNSKRGEHAAVPGVGVGLSMSRTIIEAHGGAVFAERSAGDRLTIFTIRLPLAAPATAPPAATSEFDSVRQVHGRRVLLVEDNVDVLRMTRESLVRSGLEVTCATDGYEALELASKQRPEVALIDIGLPGMGGEQLAMKLRDDLQLRAMLMVAVTGYDWDQLQQDDAIAPFEHYLQKPIDVDQLLGLIARHVSCRPR